MAKLWGGVYRLQFAVSRQLRAFFSAVVYSLGDFSSPLLLSVMWKQLVGLCWSPLDIPGAMQTSYKGFPSLPDCVFIPCSEKFPSSWSRFQRHQHLGVPICPEATLKNNEKRIKLTVTEIGACQNYHLWRAWVGHFKMCVSGNGHRHCSKGFVIPGRSLPRGPHVTVPEEVEVEVWGMG